MDLASQSFCVDYIWLEVDDQKKKEKEKEKVKALHADLEENL